MKKNIIFYTLLIIATILIIVIFITSKTYVQLAIASLLYPPIAYFAFKYYPRKTERIIIDSSQPQALQQITDPKADGNHILDTDKRTFLKMIGATGFSLLLFSLFTKRFEDLFYGNTVESQNSSTNAQNTGSTSSVESQPTDGYQIAEIDESENTYVGYTNKHGAWFILKQDVESGSFRYIKGGTDFPGNWSRRDTLLYDYYDRVFSPE